MWGRVSRRTLRLEDTEDLVTGDETNLGDTMRVAEGDTDLGGGQAFAGEFDDVFNDILRGGFKPRRGCPAVREGRGRWKQRILRALTTN